MGITLTRDSLEWARGPEPLGILTLEMIPGCTTRGILLLVGFQDTAGRSRKNQEPKHKNSNLRFHPPFMLNYGNDTLHRRSLLEWFNETAIYPNGCGLFSHIMLLKEMMQESIRIFSSKALPLSQFAPISSKIIFPLVSPIITTNLGMSLVLFHGVWARSFSSKRIELNVLSLTVYQSLKIEPY